MIKVENDNMEVGMRRVKKKNSESGIKGWAIADRPREKLLAIGRRNVTEAELLAILIHSGNAKESAVELSKNILKSKNNNLTALSQLSVKELCKFKGMGQAKAVAIIAALELGRRRKEEVNHKKKKLMSSKDADFLFRPVLADLPHEEFWIILLNQANRQLGVHFISKGGLSGTVVDPKIIFKIALEENAAAIILAHNHPSGNLEPSDADLEITRKLVKAGELLEIRVLDHLIITENTFFSLADEGLM